MDLFFVLTFMSLLAVTCRGAPARFINADAAKWLQKFGYLRQDSGWAVDLREYQTALEKMQEMYQIPVTGNIDVLTEIEMMIPRCGVADVDQVEVYRKSQGRRRRYVKGPHKWEKQYISYRITSYSPSLSAESQASVVSQAFDVWDEVVPLTFYEVGGSSTADIEIGFYSGYHNDNSPFDDQTLAHAFPPGSSSPIDGDIHFNSAITFKTDPNGNGFNLQAVLIHEIGHALGLEHSFDKGAVMYHTYSEQTRLSADDIAGVRDIYGVAGTPPPVARPTIKVQQPNSYDAIYYREGILYLIKDTTVYRQYPSGNYVQELQLSQVWPSHPGSVDSATVLGDEVIYVQGNRIWYHRENSLTINDKQGYLSTLGLPDRIDLVFAVPSENCLYFFVGSYYYRLCESSEGATRAEIPQLISTKFGTTVTNTDAAFSYDNNAIIFVKDTFCYSYNMNTTTLKGPHDFSEDMDFTKCSNGTIRLLISPLLMMVSLLLKIILS